ncbi:MAG: protein kinase domain-containing protein [Vicinamibacterales bacterium]
MPSNPIESSGRGWRRALYQWLTGVAPPQAPDALAQPVQSPSQLPSRIGHYAIVRKLGEGGMGVVYAARDERLERSVALKTISSLADSDTARKRFWREARAAASVNHPNVCQIHEIGEDHGTLFIAMELLEGESLADRLRRGPLSVSDSVQIVLGMLAALSALHGRGLVHRDVKPSNVYLTPHGVKLLDFGLARRDAVGATDLTAALTQPGLAIGTPRYMAPEQVTEEEVDGRADLFATSAILFEMLAGRPAFSGKTIVDVLHATMHEQPPALSGSPLVAAVDRVIRRGLAKRPEQRFESAEDMSDELRELRTEGEDTRALARTLTRVVVLPFHVLRPDPEIDFLTFSLPDAISSSLSSAGSLIVRSSAIAARHAGAAPDLKLLASEADVDRVVMGTLLRDGDQVRATAQLVDAPGGTLLTTHTVHATLGNLFALQDDIAKRVVEALSPPLTRETSSASAPPASPPAAPHPRAYELYLRANELSRSYAGIREARDLYLRALELDPDFAPAWAHLGRAHRVLGKYVEGMSDGERLAEEALQRALALNPRLSVAHKFYAALESDIGQSERAIVRLLHEAARHRNDPELFAGLVQACRYAGLYDEAIAAHAEARRLDPHIATSLLATLLLTDNVDSLSGVETVTGGADDGIRVMALGLAGRHEEARHLLNDLRDTLTLPTFRVWWDYLMAWLDRRPADMLQHINILAGVKIQFDPEAIFLEGWMLCEAGAIDAGLSHLTHAVAKGYFAVPTLARSRHFDPLRSNPVFRAVLADAEAGRDRALAAFREAGGERLLGRPPLRAA